jgi:hypothetical protein
MKNLWIVLAIMTSAYQAEAGTVTRELLVRYGINPSAATKALNGYDRFSDKINNQNYMTIVDFSLPGYKKRLYVINMNTGKIAEYFTTHGVNSGANWVVRTSNQIAAGDKDIGSLRTATGNFLTLHTKQSQRTGYSLTLGGQDADNKNTYARSIYVHGAKGVNIPWMKAHGGIFRRSEGCLMLDSPLRDKVISRIKGGSFLYSYWTPKAMLNNFAKSPEGSHGLSTMFQNIGTWTEGEELLSPEQ